MIGVRATASITASRRAKVGGRVSRNRPFALGHQRERGVIGDFGRNIEFEGRDIRIAGALERRHRLAGIIGAIAWSLTGQSVEPWRVGRVRCDVCDRRQLQGSRTEVGRICEQCQAEKQAEQRAAKAGIALPPDYDEAPECQENGKPGKNQRGRKGGERRHNLEQV